MINNFEQWSSRVKENLVKEESIETPRVSTEADVTPTNTQATSGRKGIMQDVDSIMTSLDALSVELTEALNEDSLDLLAKGGLALGAAGIAGLSTGAYQLYQYKVVAPKARASQKKVNAINVKIAGLDGQIRGAEPNVKQKIEARIEKAKEQRDAMQDSVDSKYADASKAVQSALSNEKDLGRMEIIKIELGDASPSREKQLKDQAKNIKAAIVKSEAEFKQAEPKKDDKVAAELTKAAEKAEKTPKDEVVDKKEDKTPKDAKEEKLDKINGYIETEEERLSKKDLEESPKLLKLQKLKDEVEAKESWQINNTELGRLIEMKIQKHKNESTLNESINLTVRDAFNKLM